MPQMADPNFARTVVLLCDYTAEDGAFGLVVNRQMSEPACEIVRTEPPVRVDPDLKLWIGGPVDPQSTWVLMAESQGPDEEQREIVPGLLLSVSRSLTLQLLQEPPTTSHEGRGRLRGLEPGAARERNRLIVLADDRGRSRAHLRRATRTDVGRGDSPPGRRPCESTDKFRSALGEIDDPPARSHGSCGLRNDWLQ